MPRKDQLSANEAFDDFNSQPVGEGFLELTTSGGSRLVFNDPASMNAYRLANPSQFTGTPDNAGSFNDENQAPTGP